MSEAGQPIPVAKQETWPARNSEVLRLFAGQILLFVVAAAIAILIAANLGFIDPRGKPALPKIEGKTAQEIAKSRADTTEARLARALCGPDSAVCRSSARLAHRAAADPQDIEASVQWGVLALADAAAAIAFYVFCALVTLSAVRDRGAKWRSAALAVAIPLVAIPIWVMLKDRPIPSRSIIALVVDLLLQRIPVIDRFIDFLNGMAVACATVIVLACFAQAIPPRNGLWTAKLLRQRLRSLQALLFFGAFLLTIGVCEMWALYHWAALPLIEVPDKILDPIFRAARIGAGGLSSLALLIAYVPPAFYLRAVSRQFAASLKPDAKQEDEWLKMQGLDGTGWEPLTRFATALSPALVSGPLAGVIQAITSVKPGAQ